MRIIPLAVAFLTVAAPAIAQTVPNIPQTGRTSAGAPLATKRDLEGVFGGKADYSALQAEVARAAAAEAGKVSAANGQLTNPTITGAIMSNPAITGGAINGGAANGTDMSQSNVMASGATRQRSAADRASDVRTPADFLASGQTEASLRGEGMDAAPAISAGLAKGNVFLPCGSYRIDTPIVFPTTPAMLDGAAPGCVTLAVTYPIGDVVSSIQSSRSEISNIRFVGRVTRTNGAILRLKGTYGFTVRNVSFDGSRFQDVVLEGTNTTKIIDSDFRPGTGDACITLSGTGAQAVDTFVSRTNLAGCGFGIYMNNASGVYLDNMDILASRTNAVLIGPVLSQGQNVNAVRANNILADTTVGGHGWRITSDAPVTELHLSNSWASGSGQQADGTFPTAYAGFYADNPNLDGAILTGFYGHRNGGQAIDIEAGQHIKLVSPMACMNSVTAANTFDGITIGAAASFVTINDPTSGECGFMKKVGFVNQQRYGLFVNNTSNQFISLIGGQYMANVTGTVGVNIKDPNLTMAGNAAACPSLTGVGAPIVPALPCATYRRTDGGNGSTFYVKESGIDGLGWVAK